MASVKAGLAGCGLRLTGVAKYLRKATDQVEFAGVCDPDPESVRATREALCPDCRLYSSIEEMSADDSIDWIMIGSPNNYHARHTLAAFAGGKHVFCEKPLATTMADVIAMKQAWEASGLRFVLGLTLRHSLFYRTIRSWLDQGRIGKLISMEFNETLRFNHGGHIHSHPWRSKTELGGSHLLEKCCHDIDLALWMAGSRPQSVASFGGRNYFMPENGFLSEKIGASADGRQPFTCWPTRGKRSDPFTGGSDVVDNQVGIIEFANDVRATFHTNCVAGIPERRMLLLGTEGAIRGDVLTGELEYEPVGFDTKRENFNTDQKGGHGGGDTILGQDLAETMLNNAEPYASLKEGIDSAVTCFAMNEAMSSHAVVDCADYWKQVD
ncbi:MAG: Gfo/Idh/MocA family protein [Verrucomicrobiota bacterium]